VLVRNLYMSVDPYMRGRMNGGKSYVVPFELGKALEGGAVGEVLESRAKEFKPGDAVISNFGWREYFIAAPKDLRLVSREFQPLSVCCPPTITFRSPFTTFFNTGQNGARKQR
jgi:NADPH-dependent curcumin reductase CurA